MSATNTCRKEVFKSHDGTELGLDVYPAPKSQPSSVALIHFHGGFLVVGEKGTFPPHWLINACHRRGWTYVTPSYRLLPEATGKDVVEDALSAAKWVAQNVTEDIIVAGSSAGGFLALATASLLSYPKPRAVLSIYGINDFSNDRYTRPGSTFMGMPPMENVAEVVEEIRTASKSGLVIAGYPFPEDENDKRMGWIAAIHQEALYPDLVSGISGLAKVIREEGVESIPADSRRLFPLRFGVDRNFPPTAFLHGNQDICVDVTESTKAEEKLRDFGVKTCMEIVKGKDHGFDVEVIGGIDVESVKDPSVLFYPQLKNILRFLDNAILVKR